ncbi:ExeA family protein [Desulforegula conservatrix]|uniref:ExeA family protein n=1 Tax=Desulforegula conservatrix TaxID=153026 RepID=UPI00040FB42C|nr:AAA family ATPase [Desulforegula conservatrix]
MIVLKRLISEAGVIQKELARRVGVGRRVMGNLLRAGEWPSEPSAGKIRSGVTEIIESNPAMSEWLKDKGFKIEDVFSADEEALRSKFRHRKPRGFKLTKPAQGLRSADPEVIEPREDTDMLTRQAMKHFQILRNPFVNDVNEKRDIYLSSEHRFLLDMMKDAARYAGFCAMIGGVGSGKSCMRKAAAGDLREEGISIVFPMIVDKSRITPASLIDAIIMDISDEQPKRSLEWKTRQALRLLKARANGGMRQVLMIEEAQMLDKKALKSLKQIYELEDGFQKLIGIILIGQPELGNMLNEVENAEIREVIRRITVCRIDGLGKELPDYLNHKLSRVGKKSVDIIAPDAFDAIHQRLMRRRDGKLVNNSNPLSVNNLVIRAMNLAAETGEPLVTADVILNS